MIKRYHAPEIRLFLNAVDAELDSSFSLVVIGGAAGLLGYETSIATTDIDSPYPVPEELVDAFESAADQTGAAIVIHHAAIAELPVHYEDRLQKLEPTKLKHLTLYFPERHDLVLSKSLRGIEHDLAMIEEIHRNQRLDLKTLVERFHEMKYATGNRNEHRLQFLAIIERLFGQSTAQQIELELSFR